MALLRWIFSIPLIVVSVYLAISNKDNIAFTYSPIHEPIEFPLYFLILASIAVGFFFGSITTWLAGGKVRKEKRALKKSVKSLEKELDTVHKKAAIKDAAIETNALLHQRDA